MQQVEREKRAFMVRRRRKPATSSQDSPLPESAARRAAGRQKAGQHEEGQINYLPGDRPPEHLMTAAVGRVLGHSSWSVVARTAPPANLLHAQLVYRRRLGAAIARG